MCTPKLHLWTLYVPNGEGRITATRELGARRGPVFTIVRGATRCAWAVRADVPREVADELDRLAREEPPTPDLREPPVHADQYVSLVGGRLWSGPGVHLPDDIAESAGVVVIEDERRLDRHFRGWVPGEIAAGRAPVRAILAEGHPVSVCFCARRSDLAAEAGLETAEAFRGRGYGPRVTAAWALAVRASGRIPLYSTSWDNDASTRGCPQVGFGGVRERLESLRLKTAIPPTSGIGYTARVKGEAA